MTRRGAIGYKLGSQTCGSIGETSFTRTTAFRALSKRKILVFAFSRPAALTSYRTWRTAYSSAKPSFIGASCFVLGTGQRS